MRRLSSDWNGNSWFSTRLRLSRTFSPSVGTLSRNFNHAIVCFSQERPSKTIWLNYGHCLTLWCLIYSIPMNSSISGSLRTFKRIVRIRRSSIRSRYSVCMPFSNHSCYGVSRRMWSMKSARSTSTKSYVRWPRDKRYCMNPSRRSLTWRSCSRCSNLRQRWRT